MYMLRIEPEEIQIIADVSSDGQCRVLEHKLSEITCHCDRLQPVS